MKSRLSVVRTSHLAASRFTAEENEHRTTLWADEQGRIIECDEDARAAFGYSPEELAGLPVSRLFPALDEVRLLADGAVNPRLAFRCRCGPFRLIHRDGADVQCQLFVNTVCLPGGPAVALIVAQPSQTRYEARQKVWAAKLTPVREARLTSPPTMRAAQA